MDGNRDDAERCLQLAQDALAAGDVVRSRRLHSKSVRMFSRPPLCEAQKRLEKSISSAEKSTAQASRPASQSARSRDTEESSTTKTSEIRDTRRVTAEMRAVVAQILSSASSGHYAVLGLTTEATDSDIKRSFKKLALALHPDKNCAPGAEEAFKHVSVASEVLLDPSRRRMYDQFGTVSEDGWDTNGSAFSAMERSARNMRRRRYHATTQQRYRSRFVYGGTTEDDLDELLAQMSPDEIFEFLFASASNVDRHERPRHEARAFSSPSVEAFWRRLGLFAAVALFLTILFSSDSASHRFSFEPTPSLTVRRVTASGVAYYVSRLHGLDDSKQSEVSKYEIMVEKSALDMYRTRCEDERGRLREIQRLSASWFSRKVTRDRYAALAEKFPMHSCKYVNELSRRVMEVRLRA